MIKTENLVPHNYYRESRDFQYFGRLYDIIFNYVKTNVDIMENFPLSNSTDSKLVELLVRTLGFKNKRNYRTDDLVRIASIFVEIIKNKGTNVSIEKLIYTILNLEGINDKPNIIYDKLQLPNNNSIDIIRIIIADDIRNSEIALLEEILDYILPTTVLYTIRSSKEISGLEDLITVQEYVSEDTPINNTNRSITLSEFDDMDLENKETVGEEIGTPENVIGGDIRFTRVNPKEEN